MRASKIHFHLEGVKWIQRNVIFVIKFISFGSITSRFILSLVLLETNEDDIITRFVRAEKTLITLEHLTSVFEVWFLGMVLGLVIFFCELLSFRLMKYKSTFRDDVM